jgi:uncharacterized membrane protein YraQ (UPF0718 family)
MFHINSLIMEQIIKIAEFILQSLIHIWPYLLVSIPMAVMMQQSGASRFISKAIGKRPVIAVLLATIVGAISPFCSCGVIPVITAMLISGIPLAPVMSFWIASPSMDPEIFFLSTAAIGWELSIWRLASTFMISLSAGYSTLLLAKYGLLGNDILKIRKTSAGRSRKMTLELAALTNRGNKPVTIDCCVTDEKCLSKEIWSATFMVVKFMSLAFLVNAIIEFYLPKDLIQNLLNQEGTFSVVIATFVGIPAYTSNLTALPLISGLLSLGMNPGAALAFLIAGPVTTIPAMIAVWGIAKPRIFALYLTFSLLGALFTGLLFNLFS